MERDSYIASPMDSWQSAGVTRLSPIGASRAFAASAVLMASLLAAGCGRLGFSSADVAQSGALPEGDEDAEERPGSHDAGEIGVEGSPGRDAGRPSVDPDAATNPAPEDAALPVIDAGTVPELDAGAHDGGVHPDAGGNTDAGSATDAGSPGPGQLDCKQLNPGALVCASFDQSFPERATTRANNGMVRLERGQLEATTSREQGSAALDIRFAEQSSGSLYLSAWVKVAGSFELTAANIVGLQASTGNDPSVDINLIAPDRFEIFVAPGNHTAPAADFSMPRDQWFCLEARILLSSSVGEVDLSVDGSSVLALRKLDTLPAVAVDQLSIGFDWTGPTQAPAHILFDNVILSTQEISRTCP
jgi:hypothetical protein